MKFILLVSLVLVTSCATRRKVFSNKATDERWTTVADNPKEFLTKEELEFLGKKK